jgi:two-component system, cell cycle sensor histidine kinase and response regulator CckA
MADGSPARRWARSPTLPRAAGLKSSITNRNGSTAPDAWLAAWHTISRMLHRLIGENIDLVVKLDPEPGNIMADPGQIEQIIIYLAVNSRDAMPTGGTLIIETANVYLDESYVRQHPRLRVGHHVMMAGTDTGTGMTPEVRDQVFEPFFTTKPKSQGTGLGLATVYGIVTQSGGWIWVYSEPGKGTTFQALLPLDG